MRRTLAKQKSQGDSLHMKRCFAVFAVYATSSGLLQHLSSLPATEVAARQRYIRSIASLLVYDTPGVERDAPAA